MIISLIEKDNINLVNSNNRKMNVNFNQIVKKYIFYMKSHFSI